MGHILAEMRNRLEIKGQLQAAQRLRCGIIIPDSQFNLAIQIAREIGATDVRITAESVHEQRKLEKKRKKTHD